MSKIYTKEEVLENGYHQIRIYDVDTQTLLSTYQTTPDGQKDGEEIEYFKDSKTIKRKTNWKDGKKDGEEIEYFKNSDKVKRKTNWKDGQKDGSEKIYTNESIPYRGQELKISVENEYEKGKLINNREYFYGIQKLDSVVKFLNKTVSGDGLSLSRHDSGTYYSYVSDVIADVVKENGEFKHITLQKWENGYKTFYDMEFKDGKEYDGRFGFSYFKAGKLTGSISIPLKESPCAEFMPSGTGYSDRRCWQTFKKGVLVSNNAYYHWSDGFDGWNYEIHIPVNGTAYKREAEDGLIWQFEMKDGKKSGKYKMGGIETTYKEDKLNGEYRDYNKSIKATYKDNLLEGLYTEFFDRIDGRKKIEGSYQHGKKEGVWKYYAEDGTVINQEYWHEGKDCTKKYETLKKVASKRIEIEDKLSGGKDERVVLPKMTAKEKQKAIREAKKDLSR